MGFQNVKGKSTTLNDSVTSEGVGDFGKAQWARGEQYSAMGPQAKTGEHFTHSRTFRIRSQSSHTLPLLYQLSLCNVLKLLLLSQQSS